MASNIAEAAAALKQLKPKNTYEVTIQRSNQFRLTVEGVDHDEAINYALKKIKNGVTDRLISDGIEDLDIISFNLTEINEPNNE